MNYHFQDTHHHPAGAVDHDHGVIASKIPACSGSVHMSVDTYKDFLSTTQDAHEALIRYVIL